MPNICRTAIETIGPETTEKVAVSEVEDAQRLKSVVIPTSQEPLSAVAARVTEQPRPYSASNEIRWQVCNLTATKMPIFALACYLHQSCTSREMVGNAESPKE